MTRPTGGALLGVLALAACGPKTGSAPASVDATMLARPAELERLFAQPAAPLGARHFEASSSLELDPPAAANRPKETLRETFRLDAGAHGQLHLLHENDHDDGLEAIVVDGRLYVRPRYGKFTVRRAEAEELVRLRGNVEGVAAGYVRLLEPWLRLTVNKNVVHMSLRGSPDQSLRDHDQSVGRAWRDSVTVSQLDGEFTVDSATGLPLDGHLDATYAFTRGDSPGAVTAQLKYEQKSTPTPEAIAAPNEVATLKRLRPLLDRQTLLDGLKSP